MNKQIPDCDLRDLTWDTAPELLDAKTLGALLTARPIWVRRNLRHLVTPLGERMLRWPKKDVLAWLEAQRVRASEGVAAIG